MAQFVLRNVDDRLWSRAMVRAQLEGWPLRDLMLALLAGYADGTVKPFDKPPRPRPIEKDGIVELRFTCPKCNKSMVVDVMSAADLSHMSAHDVDCPSCGQLTERALPGEIVKVRRG